MVILPTLAAANIGISLFGTGTSIVFPLFFSKAYKTDKISINLLDIFTLISSICYFSFYSQVSDTIGIYL